MLTPKVWSRVHRAHGINKDETSCSVNIGIGARQPKRSGQLIFRNGMRKWGGCGVVILILSRADVWNDAFSDGDFSPSVTFGWLVSSHSSAWWNSVVVKTLWLRLPRTWLGRHMAEHRWSAFIAIVPRRRLSEPSALRWIFHQSTKIRYPAQAAPSCWGFGAMPHSSRVIWVHL